MTKRKVLLTILPLFWPNMPPIGLGFLQSFLVKNNIDADILDLNNIFYNLANNTLKKEWLISCNVSLENNIISIIRSNFPREFHVVIERMLNYDVIGFSCFKSNFKTTVEIIQTLKSRKKEIKIILGGPEITRMFFKKHGRFRRRLMQLADFLVVGEGESSLYYYIKSQNISDKISEFEQLIDLDELDFPRYLGLDLGSYPKKDTLPLQFSRGCINTCRFCSERLLYRGFRSRTVKSIIDEIRYHRANNNIRYFIFFDSLINADQSRLEDLCDAIMENFGAVDWEAQISIRDDMHQKILEKMKKSGCYNLFVGLESGSDRTLKNMQKGFTSDAAVSFFERLNNAGLFFGVSIIVGYPGETEADFKESLDFIIRNKGIIPKIEQINPFTYYDGTEADQSADYKINKNSLRRMETFIRQIKDNDFKFTNAFLGNLVEKNVEV